MSADDMIFEDLNGVPDTGKPVIQPVIQDEYVEEDPPVEEDVFEPAPVEDEIPAEEDRAKLGKRAEKRINKLLYEVKSRDTELVHQRQLVSDLATRLQQIEQRQQESDGAKVKAETEARLNEIRMKRQEALDDGDLATYHRLDDEYMDARIQAREGRAQGEPPQQPDYQQPPRQPPQAQVPDVMQGWLTANKGWFNHMPESASKVNVANAIYAQLESEGFEPNEPELYREMDKRLIAVGVKKAPVRPQQLVESNGRYTGDPGGGPQRLTQGDLRSMRQYGLDPNNPKHRDSWLDGKRGAPL